MAKTKAAHLADPLGWSHECGHWPAYLVVRDQSFMSESTIAAVQSVEQDQNQSLIDN